MIDMISGGRLISGFVRGGGVGAARQQRQPGAQPRALRGGARPDHRGVDAARPLPLGGQALPVPRRQPVGAAAAEAAPAVMVPGTAQPGNRRLGCEAPLPLRRAQHVDRGHQKIWALYDATAAETGYTAGPENRGYLQRCHVAETEEKALANARQFMWMQGEFTGLAHPGLVHPVRVLLAVEPARVRRVRRGPPGEPARREVRGSEPRPDDHRGHPVDGDPEAPAPARGDAAVDPGLLGERRVRQPPGRDDVHPAVTARKCCRRCARSARSWSCGARSRRTRR